MTAAGELGTDTSVAGQQAIASGLGTRRPRTKPAHCPGCRKWGVTQWQVVDGVRRRSCRFCKAAWEPASWDAAKTVSPDPPPKIEITKNTRWKDKRGREWQVFENLHFGRYWALCLDKKGYAGEWTANEIRAAVAAERPPTLSGQTSDSMEASTPIKATP